MYDLLDTKSFMDNVHGYIRIPRLFVRHIIDTQEFQRLRNIDQTGMKILYSSAKHDRFSHSLGVFHLGSIAADALFNNFKDNLHWKIRSDKTRDVFWAKNKVLFLIACLLHDIGHTPFSHSLEQFYEFKDGEKDKELVKLLGIKKFNNLHDTNIYSEENIYNSSNEHEKMSAYLILRRHSKWKKRIKNILDGLKDEQYPKQISESDGEYDNNPKPIDSDKIDEDLQFIGRMILGIKYQDWHPEKQIQNCFIELLNGSFDVDKLDYTVRDTKMSGIGNISLDIDRLLSSLTIIPKTVYIDSDKVNIIDKQQPIIITKLILNNGDYLNINGKIDKPISLLNCELILSKGTKITLHPKENTENGVKTDDLRIVKGSVKVDHKSKTDGDDYTSTGTLENNLLEIENGTIYEEGKINFIETVNYNLILDSSDSKNPTNITAKEKIQPSVLVTDIAFTGIMFNGKISYLEILSDELSNAGIIPSENCYNSFSLGFKKQAINLISNVSEARNYLYLWIYSHHKVIYYANYLIVELSRLSILNNIKGESLRTIMSDKMSNENTVYKLDEDFINSQIHAAFPYKKLKYYDNLYYEFTSRVYRSSLYKSLAEFDLIFGDFDDEQKYFIRSKLIEMSFIHLNKKKSKTVENDSFESLTFLNYGLIKQKYLKKMDFESYKLSELIDDLVWVSSNPSLKRPSRSSIYITFGNRKNSLITTMDRLPILRMEDLLVNQNHYFYLYYNQKKDVFQKNIIEDDDDLKRIIREAFVLFMKKELKKLEKISVTNKGE
jgi:HD superfamily phosphohydrolase